MSFATAIFLGDSPKRFRTRPSALLFALFSVAISLLFTTISAAQACSEQDVAYAQRVGDYYEPAEALKFGEKIKALVVEANLTELLSLMGADSSIEWVASSISSSPFEELFPERWRQSVVNSEPPCRPVGWRGFTLGHGAIWFNRVNGAWRILQLNGADFNPRGRLPETVQVDGATLPPTCFTRPWLSGDNFEEFAEVYGIEDVSGFSSNPGLYLGKEINSFIPIKPGWCSGPDCSTLRLVHSLDRCVSGHTSYRFYENRVWFPPSEPASAQASTFYRVMAVLTPEFCSTLAPHLPAECLDGFLIESGEQSEGTLGDPPSFGVYGIFLLSGIGASVVPLRFFDTELDAINFVTRQP